MVRWRKPSASLAWAKSFLATSRTPEVSLSSRWTMPGRRGSSDCESGRPRPKECVYQRAVRIPCPGVDGHAGRFVDGDDVVVFVKDIEGNEFGFGLKGRARLSIDVDNVTGANFLSVFGGLAIKKNQALFDEFLGASAGEIGAMEGDDTVEAETGIGIGYGETELRSVGHVESVARAVGFGGDGTPSGIKSLWLRSFDARRKGAALAQNGKYFVVGSQEHPQE